MVSAIQNSISRVAANTALSPSPSRSPAAKASLEAQLAQYQRQLSECINCDSAKTLEGKNQIQAISSKIAAIRDSIAQTDQPAGNSSPASVSADGTQTGIAVDRHQRASDDNGVNTSQTAAVAGQINAVTGVNTLTSQSDQSSRPKAGSLTLGVHLDIYV